MENYGVAAPRKKNKGCLIGIIVIILFLGGLGFGFYRIVQNPEEYGAKTKKSELATLLDVSDEQEANILKIFKECGIDDVKSVKPFNAGEKMSSYSLSSADTSNIVVWVSNDKKEVQEIYFNDYDIYKDGKCVSKITDYILTKDEKTTYQTASQLLIKDTLTVPSSAKFPSIYDWKFGKIDGVIIVQSYVNSKNAFGVEIKNEFQIKFDENGNPISTQQELLRVN